MQPLLVFISWKIVYVAISFCDNTHFHIELKYFLPQLKLQKALKDYRLMKTDLEKQNECLHASVMECQNHSETVSQIRF